MMIVVQAFLSDHHGSRAVAAISEANAVSSFAAIAGPLAIALAIAIGLGWAAGFAGPALVVGGLLGLGLVASIPGSVPDPSHRSPPEITTIPPNPVGRIMVRDRAGGVARIRVRLLGDRLHGERWRHLRSRGGRIDGDVLCRNGGGPGAGSAADAVARSPPAGASWRPGGCCPRFCDVLGGAVPGGNPVWAGLGLLVRGRASPTCSRCHSSAWSASWSAGPTRASARAALGQRGGDRSGSLVARNRRRCDGADPPFCSFRS